MLKSVLVKTVSTLDFYDNIKYLQSTYNDISRHPSNIVTFKNYEI